MFDDDEPCFVISVVAQQLEVHPQTLRYYERAGLVQPSRSRGNIRLYSQRDIERLRLIQRLMDDLGVNLAGVEVILNMRERMGEMQGRMNEMLQEVLRRMEAEFKQRAQTQENSEGLVPVGRKGIVRQVPVAER